MCLSVFIYYILGLWEYGLPYVFKSAYHVGPHICINFWSMAQHAERVWGHMFAFGVSLGICIQIWSVCGATCLYKLLQYGLTYMYSHLLVGPHVCIRFGAWYSICTYICLSGTCVGPHVCIHLKMCDKNCHSTNIMYCRTLLN